MELSSTCSGQRAPSGISTKKECAHSINEQCCNCNNQSSNNKPICTSYSDMYETLDAQHRLSPLRHWFLNWFTEHYLRLSTTKHNIDSDTGHSSSNKSNVWSLNYLEASIYLEEGLNNDKFDQHPHLFMKLPLYLLTHNRLIYAIDLLASCLILGLALAEKPAVHRYHLTEAVHASLELIGLTIIAIILLLKYEWIGRGKFFKHGRSVMKSLVLLLMMVEAIVVLWRQDSHFRLTRALRPVFLVDNYYFYGVRRVLRQTFQALRSFVDMLVLLMFCLLFFSISAFYLFSTVDNYKQFSTMFQSFISLFVLLTTANFPDVMMPAYNRSQFYALFFIVFLVLNLYLLLNIMLAVVYNAFSNIEKHKFRKLYLHRRKACDHAFRLLVTNSNVDYIHFEHFSGLMDYVRPKSTQTERYLMYKALVMQVFNDDHITSAKHTPIPSRSNSFSSNAPEEYLKQIIENKVLRRRFNHKHVLTLEKFYQIYDVLNLTWTNLDDTAPWFDRPAFGHCFRHFMYRLRSIVLHRFFQYGCYLVIFLATIYQLLDAFFTSSKRDMSIGDWTIRQTSASAVFITLYTIEMLSKLLALGPTCYFARRWNWFDCIVTIISLLSFFVNRFSGLSYLPLSSSFYSFRSLKLLDLLRQHVSRYRDVLGPFALIIMKRFLSVSLVVMIVYYIFAIIAMECFGSYSLVDCCANTTIEPYYRANGTQYYYLNNFQDLITSYITLFELMVVNNWQISMQAYVLVTQTEWTYLFFLAFYIMTLVVITIVLSFVLDTFNFHIEYKQRFGPDDSISVKISVEVPLTQQEYSTYQNIDQQMSKKQQASELLDNMHHAINSDDVETIVAIPPDERFMQGPVDIVSTNVNHHKRTILFRGEKIRDKFAYNRRMYHDLLDKWIEQAQFD